MGRRRDRPLRNVKTAAYYVEKGRQKNEHHDLRGVLAAATQAKLGTTEGTWTRCVTASVPGGSGLMLTEEQVLRASWGRSS